MKMKLGSVVLTALLMAAGTGRAQTTEGWSFEVTPYAWLAGLEGDLTVRGQKVDFEKDASELLDAAEVGGSVRLGAAYDRFVIGALVDYFSLSTDELDAEDQPTGGTVDAKMLMTEVAAGYRVDGWVEGQSFVFALGVRNLHAENDLALDAGPTLSDERDITDGMIYVLPTVPLFPSSIEGLRFNPVLGIGAGDSDLAYEMFPQVQYDLTENAAIRFGYRRVGWRFEGDHGNELNVDMAGLIVGLGLKF
jgi:hypothetical protein